MIVVHGQPFSGDELLARYLAAQCGLQCVEPQVIVEKAAAHGIPHAELWHALRKPPRMLGRFSNRRRMLMTLLESALAEEIRPGQSICYGSLAELLPRDARLVLLRIGTRASLQFRVSQAWERLRMNEPEALKLIKQLDRERRSWIRHVHGITQPDETATDLTIELKRAPIDDAFETVGPQVRSQLRHMPEPMLTAAWSNYVLSCRVKAALALAPSTAHLEIDAPCDHGLVELHGKLPWTVNLHEIERVVLKVPGVNDVRVDGLRPASSEGLSLPGMFPTRTSSARPAHNLSVPWTARFAAASALAIILTLAVNGITGSVVDRIAGSWGAEKKVFVGYVTDTLCEHAAGMDPECIRSCVQRYPDVQYALSDGSNLYPLSDRSTPAIYAAQLVRVVGRFDKASGAIQIESIQPVPKDGAAYRAPVDVFGDKRTT